MSAVRQGLVMGHQKVTLDRWFPSQWLLFANFLNDICDFALHYLFYNFVVLEQINIVYYATL